MVQQWPPTDPSADDHRRSPTHRMICFQQADADPRTLDGAVASWCALYPLNAGSFAEPDFLVQLVADRTTLLDLDTGAAVSALRRPDRRWEVRPLAGGAVMLTGDRMASEAPGFAEAKGLAPLIIPRSGRTVSPYVKALAGQKWIPSPSLETVGRWRRRRRRAFALDVFVTTSMTGAAIAAAAVGHPFAILFGGVAAYHGAGTARRRWRDRVITTDDGATAATADSETGGLDTADSDTLAASLRTVVHLNWRPSPDWGAMAWVLIADDKHGQLEAPVAGLTEDLVDSFPTTAVVGGTFGSGKPVRLTLDDGTVLRTIRPLRRAK